MYIDSEVFSDRVTPSGGGVWEPAFLTNLPGDSGVAARASSLGQYLESTGKKVSKVL